MNAGPFSTLDATGAAKVTGNLTTIVTNSDTGTKNDWGPGILWGTLIEWSGASDLTVTGIAGGVAGQIVAVKNTGSKVAYFKHANTGSVAANRLTNLVTSGDTPIAAGGWIVYIFDGTNWKLIGHEQGATITIPYAAGNFLISGGTWTVEAGDQTVYSYKLRGNLLLVNIQLDTTSVTNTGSAGVLTIAAPSFTCIGNTYRVMGFCGDNYAGVASNAYFRIRSANPTQFEAALMAGAAWANATNTTYLRGDIEYAVS